VVPTKTMKVPVLLGHDFMAIPGICLTLDEGITISRKENVSITTSKINVSEVLMINYVESMSESQSLNIDPKIESQVSEYVKEMYVSEYFSIESADQSPSDVEMTISLRHSQPMSFRLRRLSYADKEKLRDILNKLLSERIIRPSESPYASYIVLVRKKNGELRLRLPGT